MFLPLTYEEFKKKIEDIGVTQGWRPGMVMWMARNPIYREIKISKGKQPYDRNLLLGLGFNAAAKIRVLHEPLRPLKVVQGYILHMLLNPARDELLKCAHGCVPEKSVVTNALPHLGARFKIHMDLKDFFPTITVQRVYGFFAKICKYESKLAWLLANLCCYKGRLPQGAPTSPMVANFVAMQLDRRLTKLIGAMGGYYTRYVDDLTFSFHKGMSSANVERFLKTVSTIVSECGFTVNAEKTSVVWNGHRRMIVTGVVVNQVPSVAREFRKNLRAAFHHLRLGKDTADPEEVSLGKLAFVNMVNPVQAKAIYRHHTRR